MTQVANAANIDLDADTEVCSFCKNPLDGLPHDGETTFKIGSYEPCPTCKAVQATGITIIEVSFDPCNASQPPVNGEGTLYSTGAWWVIPEAECVRVFENTGEVAAIEAIKESRGMFMTHEQTVYYGLWDEDMVQVGNEGLPIDKGEDHAH